MAEARGTAVSGCGTEQQQGRRLRWSGAQARGRGGGAWRCTGGVAEGLEDPAGGGWGRRRRGQAVGGGAARGGGGVVGGGEAGREHGEVVGREGNGRLDWD